MNYCCNSLSEILCHNYTSLHLFLPLVFTRGSLPFWEDEEIKGNSKPRVPKRDLFSGFRNFQTHRSECCGRGCTNIVFTARCTSETRELWEFLQQSSWRFQVLAGDKQQITAERAQERPQVRKCCRSQGGKSWIREGMALQQNKGHLVFSGRAEFVPWLSEVPSVQTTLFFTLSKICITFPAGMQPSRTMVMPPSQRDNEHIRTIPKGA